MSNIIKKYSNIDFKILNDENWDFCLSNDIEETSNIRVHPGNQTRCLVSYIDINDPSCVWYDKLYSKKNYFWDNAINNGVDSNYIGYTGVDNGIISYRKDMISNKIFYNLFTNSKLYIENGDKRFVMNKINGNNMIFDYSNDIVYEDNIICSKLNGGFYQGFFKLYGEDYDIIPCNFENAMTYEITLKKSKLSHDKFILNDRHNDNDGIFLYIGTRSENKWCKYYTIDYVPDNINNGYIDSEYVNSEYIGSNELNIDYLKEYSDLYNKDGYFSDGYISSNMYSNCEQCGKYNNDHYVEKDYLKEKEDKKYVDDEYIAKEYKIDENQETYTKDGYEFSQPNIKEIKTDNKFIFFNHTKDGFTINDWNENNEVILSDISVPNTENYFILCNNTKDGYDIHKIEELRRENGKKYDLLGDLYNNALGFQIDKDGKIGYKYLIRDCDNGGYKIISEFSKNSCIDDDKWCTIDINIVPYVNNLMRIIIYVNGKIKLISSKIEKINIRAINDLKDKQISVPYNISIGGGTQGLCDVIYYNYRKLPSYIFPLEKEFGGSFIGYIKSFKIYDCSLNKNEIFENVKFEQSFVL